MFDGDADAEIVRGQFTDDASLLTAAHVAGGGVELTADITYSWFELVGEIDVDGETMPVVCWDPGALAKKRTYDGAAGNCFSTDAMGTPFTVASVRETKNGECGMPMHDDIDEGDGAEPILRGWNLRGATLSTGLHFAHLVDADLRGADLSALDYGYATITGQIDSFTKLPAEGCTVAGDWATCER